MIFQISCEQAIAAFEARLELDELAVYQRETEAIIYKPLAAYMLVGLILCFHCIHRSYIYNCVSTLYRHGFGIGHSSQEVIL